MAINGNGAVVVTGYLLEAREVEVADVTRAIAIKCNIQIASGEGVITIAAINVASSRTGNRSDILSVTQLNFFKAREVDVVDRASAVGGDADI